MPRSTQEPCGPAMRRPACQPLHVSRRAAWPVAACLALAAPAGAARAQEAPAHGEPPSQQPPTVHEPAPPTAQRVEVSATRRFRFIEPALDAGALGSVDWQRLPFSISAWGRDWLDERGARGALQALAHDAGVQPASIGGAYDGLAVRGFSANGASSVRRDGLPTNLYADLPLEQMERVELLKGLAGFLHGMGSPGGLLNHVVKRPPAEALLNVRGVAQAPNGAYVHLDTGATAAGRGAPGWRVNLATERRSDFAHADGLRRATAGLALAWRLADGQRLQLNADLQHKQVASQPVLGPRTDGRVVPAESLHPRTLLGQPWGRYATRAGNLALGWEQALAGDWVLQASAAASHTLRDASFPAITSVAPDGRILEGDVHHSAGQRFVTASGQVQASGSWHTGSLQHQLSLGLADHLWRYADGGWFAWQGLTVGNIYRPVYRARPDVSRPPPKNHSRGEEASLFISDQVQVGPHWRLLAGLRQLHVRGRTRLASGSQRQQALQASVPAAAVLWTPIPPLTLYLSATEGLEQGAYAPIGAVNVGERLGPVRSRQLELGLKARPARGLQASAAWFDIVRPLQAVDPRDRVFRTLGRQQHRGLELSLLGSLSRDLSLQASAGWLQAEVQGTADAREGKVPPNVAPRQASLWLDGRLRALPGLHFGVGGVHIAQRMLDQVASVAVPGFVRWDAGLRAELPWGDAGQRPGWRLDLLNLADRRYWESVNYGGVLAGAPRTLQLSLEWRR